MFSFKNRARMRRLKTLLRPDADVAGSGSEDATRQRLKQANRKLAEQLRHANKRLARQEEVIAALRARLAKKEAGGGAEGIKPENIVWVLGSGKTGSTWLSTMMRELPDHARWNEPTVGYLFGHHYYERKLSAQHKDNFILGTAYRETWLSSIRTFVLEGATIRFPEVVEKGGYLVIKEPHGSIGAPLLMEALPESRIVFLVRDPRDVAASTLHTPFARKKGRNPKEGSKPADDDLWAIRNDRLKKAEERPDEFVRVRAVTYLRDIQHTKQAYEAHEGHKALVRYEDLRENTLGEMTRLYAALEIDVDEKELNRAVEKHAWENIPEDKKGPGTVRRRGTFGGWREDLSPRQAEIVEHITAPLLEEFYG
jgi:hypothetical protein